MQAATRLTRKCQLQGFNPEFTVSMNADGKYQGKVNVNGIEVVDQRTWPNAGLAKQHVATKALDEDMTRVDSRRGSNRRSGDNDRPDDEREAPKVPMEIRLALACIRRMGGRGRDIPDDLMENPDLARGFVMGFEFASGLADEDQQQRHRSLSPRVGERERAERNHSMRNATSRHTSGNQRADSGRLNRGRGPDSSRRSGGDTRGNGGPARPGRPPRGATGRGVSSENKA